MRRRITTAKREEIEKEQKLLDNTIVRPFESLHGLPISYSRPPGQYEDILKHPLTVKDSAVLYNSLLRSRNTFVHHAPMFKLHWVRQTAYAKKLAEMDKEKQKEVLEDRENKRRFAKATSNSLEAHFRQPVLTPEINARDVMSKLCESSITLGPHTMDIRIYIAKDARSDKSKRGQPLAPGPGDQTISLNRAFLTLPPLERKESKPSEDPTAAATSERKDEEASNTDVSTVPEGASTEKAQTSESATNSEPVVPSNETSNEGVAIETPEDQSGNNKTEALSSQVEKSGNDNTGSGSSQILQSTKEDEESELREADEKMEVDEVSNTSVVDKTVDDSNIESDMLQLKEITSNTKESSKDLKEHMDFKDNDPVGSPLNENEPKESEHHDTEFKEELSTENDFTEGKVSEISEKEAFEKPENHADDQEEELQEVAPATSDKRIDEELFDVEENSKQSSPVNDKPDQNQAPDNKLEEPAQEDGRTQSSIKVEVEELVEALEGVEEEVEQTSVHKESKPENEDGDVKKEAKEDEPEVNTEDKPNPPKRGPGRPKKRGRPRKVPVEILPERPSDQPRRLSRLQQEASKPPVLLLPSPSPSPPPKRKYKRRGRPPKNPRPETSSEEEEEEEEEEESPEPEPQPPKVKRGRGRPRIHPIVEAPKKKEVQTTTEDGNAENQTQKETGASSLSSNAPPRQQVVQQPPRPPANLQSIDNVIMISNLNTIAETDLSLNGLMQRVASGKAPEEEVNRFKGYIEQARKMGPQPHHAELYFKHGLPLPPNFPKVYPVKPPIEPHMAYPQRQNNIPKLTAFQERYLYNATLVIEFHENANVRYIIPQDSICEVLPPEKAPPEEIEEGMEYKDVLFSHVWIHNMDEVLRFEKEMEEYDKELKIFKKEEEEKKKLAEENEKRLAEGLPIKEEPVSNEPRALRTKKKAPGSKKAEEGPSIPKDPSLKFTTYSFTLHNIPVKYVPIVVNSVKPAPEIRERMEKILRTGTRIPSHFLWYRVDARLDEKFAESLRCKAVEEEMDMPGYVPPVEPKKRKTPQVKNPKQKRLKEESPDVRPVVQGYPMTAKGYTPVLNTGVTGPAASPGPSSF